MEEKKKDPIYVAFDTDIISHLSEIHRLVQKNVQITRDDFSDNWQKCNVNYLLTLYNKIINDEIRPVAVNTVFHEARRLKKCEDFMRDCCYFPNYNMANMRDKQNEIMKLAETYCEPFESNGKLHSPAMKRINNEYARALTPTSDAFAMAEATIEGLVFVTANERDFIKDESDYFFDKYQKGSMQHRGSRRLTIININKDYGYGGKSLEDTPRPESFADFMYHVIKGNLSVAAPKHKIIKAESVMGDDL